MLPADPGGRSGDDQRVGDERRPPDGRAQRRRSSTASIPDDAVQAQRRGRVHRQQAQAEDGRRTSTTTPSTARRWPTGTQKAWRGAKGVSTAAIETRRSEGQDFSAAVNKMKALSPDVIFYGGYYAEAGRLKKQLSDGGVTRHVRQRRRLARPGLHRRRRRGRRRRRPAQLPVQPGVRDVGGQAEASSTTAYKAQDRQGARHCTRPRRYDAANILIKGIKAGNTTRPKLLEYVEGASAPTRACRRRSSSRTNGNVKVTDVFFVFRSRAARSSCSRSSTAELL